jgi:outer membrane protein
MNHLLQRIGMAGFLSTAVLLAHAQEFRIGFVSTDRIFKEAATAKAAQTKLEQEFSKREKDLVDQGASLKSGAERLEREAPTLSESQRANRQKQLVDQDRDFQRKQVAEAEKYDLILQEAVYVNPKHDITEKVIKVLNSAAAR